MHVLYFEHMQENNKVKKIPLTELQPDSRFIIDVNDITGNLNRKP